MEVERVTPLALSAKQAEFYAKEAVSLTLKRKVSTIKSLGGGSFGHAFRVTLDNKDSMVVKLLRAKGMLAKEVYDLTLLKKHCPLKMPAVIFTRESDGSIPVDCYAMETIAGKPAFMRFGMLLMKKQKRLEFAEKVTFAQHAIHQVKNECFGDTLCPQYRTWTDCYRPFALQVLKKAEELHREGKLSKKIIETMRAAWEKFDIIFSEPVRHACLIHGDLNVGNIMVDKNYKITGFIDPLNSMYADAEYDLFQFNNLTGKRFYLCQTYKQKYGCSKYFEQKLAFYGLWNEVFCYIKAGVLIGCIMNPLVKNMRKRLLELI